MRAVITFAISMVLGLSLFFHHAAGDWLWAQEG